MKFSECRRLFDDCWLNHITPDEIQKEFESQNLGKLEKEEGRVEEKIEGRRVEDLTDDSWIKQESTLTSMDEKKLFHIRRIAKLASGVEKSRAISILWKPGTNVLVDGNHRLCAANFLYAIKGIDVDVTLNFNFEE